MRHKMALFFEDERKLPGDNYADPRTTGRAGQLGQAGWRRGVEVESGARSVDRGNGAGSPQAELGRCVMTAELIAIIALGGLLTPILLAMNGRMNSVADRLQTLGERVAKVEAQIEMALRGGGAAQMHDQFARDSNAIADRMEAAELPMGRQIAVAYRDAARRHAEQAEALRR